MLCDEESTDRSGGHCIKRRARTGEEGDVRSGGHRQVRRALYGGKEGCRLVRRTLNVDGGGLEGIVRQEKAFYSEEGADRSEGRHTVRRAL